MLNELLYKNDTLWRGAVKRYTRNNCDYSLEEIVPEVLNIIIG